ncbi:MAG: hypothetical protein KDD66_15325 [Bdellovibrionales bacterium]|nr:hypothetical protein [Bdellovibrionales bacterium]
MALRQIFIPLFAFILFLPAASKAQGLLFPDGIEPGSASQCEAPAGSTCYWVDSDAPGGGNGSYNSPYNSFEEVAGWQTGANYHAGQLRSGDYLYVRGYFDANNHDESSHSMRIHLGRGYQGGTPTAPTVIKSWRGNPRAVFDGRHWLNDMIKVSALSDDHNRGVLIQNIELKRSAGRAIDIGTYVRYADVASVVIRDGIGDSYSGEGGAILFRAQTTLHDFKIRNSLLYGNQVSAGPNINNIGAVSILSSTSALPGSRVVVKHSVIHDETTAIRHKHSGTVQTFAHNNEIYNVERAFYLRSHENYINDNLIYNAGDVFFTETENQTGQIKANIHDNRVFNSSKLLNPGYGSSSHPTTVELYNNIFLNVGGADFKGTDSDGDGLSNDVEYSFGTNVAKADTDGDGVSDAKELTDETDPFNRGSGVPQLPTILCSEWNGYLYPMWNVLELVSVGSTDLVAQVRLYGQDASLKDVVPLTIAAGTQFDLLVHDLPGRKLDSYGLICVEHQGAPGALDGRMAYYRGAPLGSEGGAYEFAFGMDLSAGKVGRQYVGYNTFNPSLSSESVGNVVVNWLQLTNVGPVYGTGQLRYYDINGNLIAVSAAALGPGQRQDYSGHFFGANKIGLVEWVPDNPNLQFQFRNVRYVYDNPLAINTFDTAFQLEGSNGSSEEVVIPITTEERRAILEISNPESTAQAYELLVTDYNGQYVYGEVLNFAPKSGYHILINDYLGDGAIGRASITPVSGGKVHAVLMNYSYDSDNNIWSMYGIKAKEPVGAIVKSSYNTYLGQDAEVWIVNNHSSHQFVHLGIVRSDGTAIVTNEELFVPGPGMIRLRLSDYESPNHYGVITLIPEHENTLAAWVTRSNEGSYIFPSAAR